MEIFVDADACPVVHTVEQVAARYKIPVTLICDTHHLLQSDYSKVRMVDPGADAVDFVLVNLCKAGDVVVTQDYGVAAMALGKKAMAIHHSGRWYTQENIDQLLMERFLNKTARKKHGRHHLKNSPRMEDGEHLKFKESFEKLILSSENIHKGDEDR